MPYQIIHGEEEFLRTEEINRLRKKFEQPGLGDLNCSMLDGRKLTLKALREAVETMPFLADKRLVVVYDLLSRCEPAAKSDGDDTDNEPQHADPAFGKEIIAYLALVPAFTFLVFYEARQLSARNPVLKHALADATATVKHCDKLKNDVLPAWLTRLAKEKELNIAGDATRVLLSQVGNNLRQLDTELDKLAGYAEYGTIQLVHVQQLASENLEARIFNMVDALGRRERKIALHELTTLLTTGAHPLYILTMVVRQYRLLLMVKDLIEGLRLSTQSIAQELNLREFVAEKLVQQARLYQPAKLLEIYETLVLIDQGIKTGRIEGELALELLVFDISEGVHQDRNLERTRRAISSSSLSPDARSR